MHDRLLRHRICGRRGWRLLHRGTRRDAPGTYGGTRHRGHGAGGPVPYPGGQRHAGGRLLRRQAAYHRDHESGQLFLHPDRPGQRGQGNRRSLLEPGGRSRPDGADGRWADGGKASCLYLRREMPGRCGEYRLSGLRGEYERVRRKSAGGGTGARTGAGEEVRQQRRPGTDPAAGSPGRRRSLRLHQVHQAKTGRKGQRRPGRL